MIPFFVWQTIPLGPLTIQVWGLFVSLGALAVLFLSLKLAREKKLSKEIILDLFIWLIVGGMLGARIFHVLFYEPVYYFAHPGEIMAFWQGGASSLGGFAGALAALWIYLKIQKISLDFFMPYLDIFGATLWLGWAIGRIGCFMIHDHPGRLTNLFFAVNFPGGARLDLGLLESVISLAVFVLVFWLYRKFSVSRPGYAAITGLSVYAIVRFFLDFLRASDLVASDARYIGLTPAQWGMVVLLIGLTFWLYRAKFRRQKNTQGRVA